MCVDHYFLQSEAISLIQVVQALDIKREIAIMICQRLFYCDFIPVVSKCFENIYNRNQVLYVLLQGKENVVWKQVKISEEEWKRFLDEFDLKNTDSEKIEMFRFLTSIYQLNFNQFQFFLDVIKMPQNQSFVKKVASEQLGFEVVANMSPPSYDETLNPQKLPNYQPPSYDEIYLN